MNSTVNLDIPDRMSQLRQKKAIAQAEYEYDCFELNNHQRKLDRINSEFLNATNNAIREYNEYASTYQALYYASRPILPYNCINHIAQWI